MVLFPRTLVQLVQCWQGQLHLQQCSTKEVNHWRKELHHQNYQLCNISAVWLEGNRQVQRVRWAALVAHGDWAGQAKVVWVIMLMTIWSLQQLETYQFWVGRLQALMKDLWEEVTLEKGDFCQRKRKRTGNQRKNVTKAQRLWTKRDPARWKQTKRSSFCERKVLQRRKALCFIKDTGGVPALVLQLPKMTQKSQARNFQLFSLVKNLIQLIQRVRKKGHNAKVSSLIRDPRNLFGATTGEGLHHLHIQCPHFQEGRYLVLVDLSLILVTRKQHPRSPRNFLSLESFLQTKNPNRVLSQAT